MEEISIRYRRSDFLARIFHASTSALVRDGEAQRTAAIESKTTLRKGNFITAASSFFVARGNFLQSKLTCGSLGAFAGDFPARPRAATSFRSVSLDLNRTKSVFVNSDEKATPRAVSRIGRGEICRKTFFGDCRSLVVEKNVKCGSKFGARNSLRKIRTISQNNSRSGFAGSSQ